MSLTLEQETPDSTDAAQRSNSQDESIAERLELFRRTMAIIEARAPRTEGRSPTTREIREMAYEEREASLR